MLIRKFVPFSNGMRKVLAYKDIVVFDQNGQKLENAGPIL